MVFKLESSFKPAGDQPKAIKKLVQGILNNKKYQVLLGATGTGKTFTIANVIAKTNKTTIVLSHNKTLAAQLYAEFKQLFPKNRVEYFISNFDYYRPEAYLPSTDTYIDKTSKTNWDIEAMRLSALNALSTRKDTIVVASVAAIYGQIAPQEYKSTFMTINVGEKFNRKQFFLDLVKRNYSRNNLELKPGTFRARGDVIEIAPSWTLEYIFRLDTLGNKINQISKIDYQSKNLISSQNSLTIFPADAYTTSSDIIKRTIKLIEEELKERLKYFRSKNKLLEAERLEQRTRSDIESLREFGTTTGIENYSRHLNGRKAGQRPYTILDFLPKDALMIIDESHMMIPQLHAMYNGDRSRKETLVEYGFRLPSALDNRPLKFSEWENDFRFQRIFISATPAEYELSLTNGEVVSQIIRPTGLLDPTIEVVPIKNQVEHIHDLLQKQKKKKERTLILTISKRMAEELTRHFQEKGLKIAYLHSDHKAFERYEILRKLRKGIYDTVVGINLLREGIDLPEVSLILVLDADKESFFRSTKSLIQIVGRAARNQKGHIVFYADNMTKSMEEAIKETSRRRKIQEKHNKKFNIKPQTIIKPIPAPLNAEYIDEAMLKFEKLSKQKRIRLIDRLREEMFKASKKLNFEKAAQLRDIVLELEAINN